MIGTRVLLLFFVIVDNSTRFGCFDFRLNIFSLNGIDANLSKNFMHKSNTLGVKTVFPGWEWNPHPNIGQ